MGEGACATLQPHHARVIDHAALFEFDRGAQPALAGDGEDDLGFVLLDQLEKVALGVLQQVSIKVAVSETDVIEERRVLLGQLCGPDALLAIRGAPDIAGNSREDDQAEGYENADPVRVLCQPSTDSTGTRRSRSG